MLAPISFVEDWPLFQLTLLMWWRIADLSRHLCAIGSRFYSSRVNAARSTRESTSLHILAQVTSPVNPRKS